MSFIFHSLIYTYLALLSVVFTIIQHEDLQQFDTSNVNEAQIRSVLSQNVEVDGNSTGSNATVHRCQACRMREDQKRHRIASIKNRISHALKLDVLGLPNMTNLRTPRVPSYQKLRQRHEMDLNLDLLEMQSDAPYSRRDQIDDEEEEFGRRERTYIFSKEPPTTLGVEAPNSFYFELPNLGDRQVYRAIVSVYISPRNNYNLSRNVSEIFLYYMAPPGKHGGPPVKRFIKKRKKNILNTPGWHNFEVSDIVRKWIRNPARNLGLVAEAFDSNNYNLITLPSVTGIDESYVPMLELKTRTSTNSRGKRSTSLVCDDNNQFEACCRYPLMVDFVEFGWDFVIAPHRYAAYYCAGDCKNEGMNSQPHAVVSSQVHSRINASKAGPCCTPAEFRSLSMLYFDHEQRVQFTVLPRMKVHRCGCA